MSNARKTTNRIMELMDEGMLDSRQIADMCLGWLSEADVTEMAKQNDIAFVFGNMYEDDDDFE